MSSSPPQQQQEEHTTIDAQGRWLLFATVVASGMGFLAQSALNPAFPVIQNELGATGAELLWIVNAYQLLLGALILVGGSLGDHYGRKRVFAAGIVLFAVASLLSGLAPTTELLIGSRLLQGLGGALMIPGSLALISAYFDGKARGQAIGIWSSFTTMLSIAGPVIGGALADAGLWRAIFFINIPLALVALYVLITHVVESKDEEAPDQLDYVGALLATAGLSGIVYAFTEVGRLGLTEGLQTPRIIVALIGGVLAIIAFVYVESRSDHPLVPLALFRSRTFSGANLITLMVYGALTAILFFVPLNLIQVQGYTATAAGLAEIPVTILIVVMSPFMGGLVERIGPRLPLIVGPLLLAVAFIALSLPGVTTVDEYLVLPAIDALNIGEVRLIPMSYFSTFFPAMVLFGLGMGCVVAPVTTAVMGAVPKHTSGVASGINNAVSRASGVLAVALMGGIALITFSSGLMERTDALQLPPEARATLEAEAENLAEAEIPDQLNAEQTEAVQTAIDQTFVSTFNLLMWMASGMCFVAAALAAIFVEKKLEPPPELLHAEALQNISSPPTAE